MTRIAAVLIGVVTTLLAQQPPARIEFEAASIQPDNPALSQNGKAHIVNGSAGGIRDINITAKDLIMGAYGLRTDSQLVGGPGWLGSAGWDIVARYPAGSDEAQHSGMMQALLADRFQLRVHRETRRLSVYSLAVAKNGPRLSPVTATGARGMSAGPRMIRYDDVSMPELASQLSSYLGTPVSDRTGLGGRYAIKLSFAPVQPDAGGAADSGPSIFTALQEQAGLQLNSGKGPVEVLVIDKVAKPSAN